MDPVCIVWGGRSRDGTATGQRSGWLLIHCWRRRSGTPRLCQALAHLCSPQLESLSLVMGEVRAAQEWESVAMEPLAWLEQRDAAGNPATGRPLSPSLPSQEESGFSLSPPASQGFLSTQDLRTGAPGCGSGAHFLDKSRASPHPGARVLTPSSRYVYVSARAVQGVLPVSLVFS